MRISIGTCWTLLTCLIVFGTAMGQSGMAAPDDSNNRRGGPEHNDRQGPPKVPDSAQVVEMVDELATELSLTEDQKEAVLELHQTHFAEARELMSQNSGDRESHRKQMDSLRDEFLEDMKELMSDEQFEKFEELTKKHDPRSGPPRHRGN